MFLKMKSFMNEDPVVINTSQIIRMVGMKEHKGSVITMADGQKIVVRHNLDDILDRWPYVEDMTKEDGEDGTVGS